MPRPGPSSSLAPVLIAGLLAGCHVFSGGVIQKTCENVPLGCRSTETGDSTPDTSDTGPTPPPLGVGLVVGWRYIPGTADEDGFSARVARIQGATEELGTQMPEPDEIIGPTYATSMGAAITASAEPGATSTSLQVELFPDDANTAGSPVLSRAIVALEVGGLDKLFSLAGQDIWSFDLETALTSKVWPAAVIRYSGTSPILRMSRTHDAPDETLWVVEEGGSAVLRQLVEGAQDSVPPAYSLEGVLGQDIAAASSGGMFAFSESPGVNVIGLCSSAGVPRLFDLDAAGLTGTARTGLTAMDPTQIVGTVVDCAWDPTADNAAGGNLLVWTDLGGIFVVDQGTALTHKIWPDDSLAVDTITGGEAFPL